jgi:hypothetical protein
MKKLRCSMEYGRIDSKRTRCNMADMAPLQKVFQGLHETEGIGILYAIS